MMSNQSKPAGITLPVKMRMVYKVIIWCEPVKRVTFCRRGVETKYTNPHIYTGETWPKNKDIKTPPDIPATKDNMIRLRRALSTLNFKPSIDLENDTEEWRIRDE